MNQQNAKIYAALILICKSILNIPNVKINEINILRIAKRRKIPIFQKYESPSYFLRITQNERDLKSLTPKFQGN